MYVDLRHSAGCKLSGTIQQSKRESVMPVRGSQGGVAPVDCRFARTSRLQSRLLPLPLTPRIIVFQASGGTQSEAQRGGQIHFQEATRQQKHVNTTFSSGFCVPCIEALVVESGLEHMFL